MLNTTHSFNSNFIKNTSLKFKDGLLPVVVQSEKNKKVLLLAYVNKQALEQSIQTKILTLWSRSRNCLWVKGATSGNFFYITKIFIDCKQNSLLFVVYPKKGGICHTKNKKGEARESCFYRELNFKTNQLQLV